jgi:hypothetical protein
VVSESAPCNKGKAVFLQCSGFVVVLDRTLELAAALLHDAEPDFTQVEEARQGIFAELGGGRMMGGGAFIEQCEGGVDFARCAQLTPILKCYASSRNDGERFGDFCMRTVVPAAVTFHSVWTPVATNAAGAIGLFLTQSRPSAESAKQRGF